jgi:hypothetical protein
VNALRQEWLFYALGGGLGHFARALALARAASRRANGHVDCTVVVNTPWSNHLRPFIAQERVDWRFLSPTANRGAIGTEIAKIVASRAWDLLIVDTFPRGLGGELAPLLDGLGCPRVLVHRDLEPRYVEERRIESFVAEHYDLLLAPGERGPLADMAECQQTAPWLMRDADELLARDEARAAFGATTAASLVLVSAAGRPEELPFLRAVADALASPSRHVVFSSLAHGGHFPLLERLAGVDVIVGGGGYHTVAEARATGTPLVGIALPRRYDRQARRLHGFVVAYDEASLRDAVARALETDRSRCPSYVNGVHEALAALDRLVEANRATALGLGKQRLSHAD